MNRDDIDPSDCIDLAKVRLSRSTDMIDPEIRALFAYWDALRADRTVPFRSEVDPRAMRCDPRNLFILEDLGRDNIRFRLAGTALVEAFGMELRGMSARSMMQGKARESFGALISETLAEPGVGYARLRRQGGARDVWEVLLLPLRSDFGQIDRLIGCLHPVSGVAPMAGTEPLSFAIEEMSIRPIEGTTPPRAGRTGDAGFAEDAAAFTPAPRTNLRAITGGRSALSADTPRPGGRPILRLVKDE